MMLATRKEAAVLMMVVCVSPGAELSRSAVDDNDRVARRLGICPYSNYSIYNPWTIHIESMFG